MANVPNINQGPGGPALTTNPSQFNVPIVAPNPTGTGSGGGGGGSWGDPILPSTNNLVTTANQPTTTFNQLGTQLNTLLNQLGNNQMPKTDNSVATLGNTNDAYTQMLDRISGNADAATKALVSTIQAQRSQQGNNLNSQYDNYKRGLQLLGIQKNEAQSTPDLLLGHIQQTENEHQQKLNELDVNMNKALIDAQSAKDNNDLKTLQEKMAYIKDLNQQKQDYLKNIAENITSGATIAEHIVGGDYEQFKTLSPQDQQKYIQAVSSAYGIPVSTVNEAISKEKAAAEKAAFTAEDQNLTLQQKRIEIAKASKAASDGTWKASSDQTAGLLGAGFTSSDIPTIENAVNKYGVVSVLDDPKGLLTDAQKTVLETIFGASPTKKKSGGIAGFFGF